MAVNADRAAPAGAPGPINAGPSGGIDRAAFPFAGHYFQAPAGRMHYVDEGPAGRRSDGKGPSGPGAKDPGSSDARSHGGTLLFVHGTPTWSFEWRHLIRAFSDRYRCVAPDHLGFGLSDRPHGFAYTPEAHAENLEAFVLGLGLRDITLVVHDFGGPIGLPLRLRRPDLVKRVVIVNSWLWSFAGDKAMERSGRLAGGSLGRWLYRYADFSLKVLMPYAYGDRKKLTPAIHRQYRERFPDANSRERVLWTLARALLASGNFYGTSWKGRERLRDIPVLLIWGMRDRAFPPAMLERWQRELPQAQVAALPEAGHWPHEEDPSGVEKTLRAFLESEPA
jgi:haloalkane dehalogenase